MSCAGDPLDVLGRPGPWLDLTLKKTIGWSSSPQYAPLIGTFIIGGQFHCRKHSYSYTGWWRWSSPSSHLIRLCSLMLRYWLRTIISQSFVRNSGRQGMKSVSIVFWLHLNLSERQTNEQKKDFVWWNHRLHFSRRLLFLITKFQCVHEFQCPYWSSFLEFNSTVMKLNKNSNYYSKHP